MRKVTCHIPPSVRLLVVGTVLVLSVSSCKTSRILNEAEQVVQTAPDSAAALLSGIDSTHLFFPSLKARYRLVNAIVMDKKHLAEDGSYLGAMRWCWSYYRIWGSRRHKMLANYYLGNQLVGTGNLMESMVYTRAAHDWALRMDDTFYCAISARRMAELYQENHNSKAAVRYAEDALAEFDAGGFPLHRDYMYLDLAVIFTSFASTAGDYAHVDSLYRMARAAAMKNGDQYLLARSLKGLASVYSEPPLNQPDSVIVLLAKVGESCDDKLSARDLARLAWAYHQKGLTEKAEKCLADSYAACQSSSDSLSPLRFGYAMRKNPNDEATRLLEQAQVIQNRLIYLTLEQSLSEAQVDYLAGEKNRLSLEKRYLVLVILLSLCLLLGIFYSLVRITRKMRRQAIEKRIQMMDQQVILDELREKTRSILFAQTPPSLLGQSVFDSLCSAVYLPGTDKKENVYQTVMDLMEKFKSGWGNETAIVDYVNRMHNNLLVRMQEQIPHWNKECEQIVSLLVVGFSYTTISILTGKEKAVLYNRVSRLRDRIGKNQAPDAAEFLSFLPNRSSIPQD